MRSLQIPIEHSTTDQSRNDNDDERGETKQTKLEDEEKRSPQRNNTERSKGRISQWWTRTGREDETREQNQKPSDHTLTTLRFTMVDKAWEYRAKYTERDLDHGNASSVSFWSIYANSEGEGDQEKDPIRGTGEIKETTQERSCLNILWQRGILTGVRLIR